VPAAGINPPGSPAVPSTSDARSVAAGKMPRFTAVSVEDALGTLQEPPTCSVCAKLSDRSCLAALGSSFLMMTPKQRLTVQTRLFPASVVNAGKVCSSSSKGRDERACLAVLDNAWAQLGDKHRLELLLDGCALASYGRAAAAVAVVTLGSPDAETAVNYALVRAGSSGPSAMALQTQEPGGGGAGMPQKPLELSSAMASVMTRGSSCSASFCLQLQAMMSAAAVAAADLLAMRLADSRGDRAAALKASFQSATFLAAKSPKASAHSKSGTTHLGMDDCRAAVGALVATASQAAARALQRFNEGHPAVRAEAMLAVNEKEVGELEAWNDAEAGLAEEQKAPQTTTSVGSVLIGFALGVAVAIGATWLFTTISHKFRTIHRKQQKSNYGGSSYQNGSDAEMNRLVHSPIMAI
jgi:hypothetical protein